MYLTKIRERIFREYTSQPTKEQVIKDWHLICSETEKQASVKDVKIYECVEIK